MKIGRVLGMDQQQNIILFIFYLARLYTPNSIMGNSRQTDGDMSHPNFCELSWSKHWDSSHQTKLSCFWETVKHQMGTLNGNQGTFHALSPHCLCTVLDCCALSLHCTALFETLPQLSPPGPLPVQDTMWPDLSGPPQVPWKCLHCPTLSRSEIPSAFSLRG